MSLQAHDAVTVGGLQQDGTPAPWKTNMTAMTPRLSNSFANVLQVPDSSPVQQTHT
jgi:hypothetical protein